MGLEYAEMPLDFMETKVENFYHPGTMCLVGIGAIRILISQRMAEIQPLFYFGKIFFGNQFHVIHRSLDLNMGSIRQKMNFF